MSAFYKVKIKKENFEIEIESSDKEFVDGKLSEYFAIKQVNQPEYHPVLKKSQIQKVEKEINKGKDPKKSSKKQGGAGTYLKVLIGDGFFKNQKEISHVMEELVLRAHRFPQSDVSKALFRLCKKQELRRLKAKSGNFAYTNWY